MVVDKHTNELRFRVKNPQTIYDEPTQDVVMDPPIVALVNKGENNVVYPVLKGVAAAEMTLTPG